MKTKLILISTIVAFISLGARFENKYAYLELNIDELEKIGIELNEEGLFYKNLNPNWVEDGRKYAGLGVICQEDNYVTTVSFNEKEEIAFSDKEIKSVSHHNFYPVYITSETGEVTFFGGNTSDFLVPIKISMAEATQGKRNDTLIFWFKHTEDLETALPENVDINLYRRRAHIKQIIVN
jgi:hypothetical protein